MHYIMVDDETSTLSERSSGLETTPVDCVCIEVGASSVESVALGGVRVVQRWPIPVALPGVPLLIAVPGLIEGTRVVAASNLDWYDVDPAAALGVSGPADLVCNDAEAAALGESALRPGQPDLVFLGLGTGVGGAVVTAGVAVANLFAHGTVHGDRACGCGRTGCLETVAGGWALPTPIPEGRLTVLARLLADAVRAEPRATPRLVVLAGGLTRSYPALVGLLADELPDREVVPTAAQGTKSAAAWGLRLRYEAALLAAEPASA